MPSSNTYKDNSTDNNQPDVYIDEKKTPRELLYKYLHYLPLFFLILLISLGITYLYIRYTTPVYSSSIEILVKDDSKKSGTELSDQILSQLISNGKTNIANELEIVKSPNIMLRVVNDLRLNTVFYSEGKLNEVELYDTAHNGFVIFSVIRDSFHRHEVNIQVANNKIYYVIGKNKQEVFNNSIIRNAGYDFTINVPDTRNFKPEYTYKAVWLPPTVAAQNYSHQVDADALNKEASIMVLKVLSESPKKGKDILNATAAEYNNENIDEKNIALDNTIAFVNDRLLLISNELGGVENQLQNYRQTNNVIDVQSQETHAFDNTKDLKDKMDALQVQLGITDMISGYVNDPSRKFTLVPSTLGIEDPTLLELIKGYNDGVLQREELLKTLPPGNIAVVTLEDQIGQLQNKIVEDVANIKKSLTAAYDQASGEYNKLLGGINTIPEKEKQLLEIERQQGIKEKLYLYLLEKREETAINRSAAVGNSVPISPATSSAGPVSPNKSNLYLIAVLISVLIPAAIVYLRDLFNDTVTTRGDILKYTTLPILGEINHSTVGERKIVVDRSRSALPEQFRIIRTNLQYFLPSVDKSTFLITSTIVGEGKTFISMNLGAILSLSGKKTILLEIDLRKPKISKALDIETKGQGISSYLIGKSSLQDIIVPVPGWDNFFLLPAGAIPPNPAELLLSPRVDEMFKELKESFDYIIVDCPPVGMVSDAKILANYSNVVLYILRQRYTLKKQLEFVHNLYVQETFKNMALLVNDVQAGGLDGYYGHSGKYAYGTSYNYSYDYNYGYAEDAGRWSRWWSRFKK